MFGVMYGFWVVIGMKTPHGGQDPSALWWDLDQPIRVVSGLQRANQME